MFSHHEMLLIQAEHYLQKICTKARIQRPGCRMSKDLAGEKRRGEEMAYKEVIRAIVGAKVFGPFHRANRL